MPWGAVAGAVASAAISSAMAPDASGQQTSNQATELQKQQGQIAQEQWDRYKQVGQPLEDQYIGESQGMGSEANQNKAAQNAAAATAGAYRTARERLNKMPGGLSQQARTQNELALELGEAGSSAGAQTAARENVVNRGRAAQTDALSLVKGLPASAGSMLGSAASGLAASGQFQTGQDNAMSGAIGKTVGGISTDAINKWINSPSANTGNYGFTGAGTANMGGPSTNGNGGYTVPTDTGSQVFNNPSAFTG